MLFLKPRLFQLSLISLTLFVLSQLESCQSNHKPVRVSLSKASAKIKPGDTLEAIVRNLPESAVQSLQFSTGEQILHPARTKKDKKDAWHFYLPLEGGELGEQQLKVRSTNEDLDIQGSPEFLLLSGSAPVVYGFKTLETYPHDREAFTQGLEFDGDILWESTGQYGTSSLRKVDYRTGKVLMRKDLPRQYFGEGITIWKDSVIMLTWKSGKGFVFDRSKLEPLGEFQYGSSKQGWGLCHDDSHIYKSDGSRFIWKLNPKTLREEGKLQIVSNRSSFRDANELEYFEGKIYANVFGKFGIMIIDADSGAIEGIIDLSKLESQIEKGPDWDPANNVLNGIAVHPERKTLFVTGKNWDKLFEIETYPL